MLAFDEIVRTQDLRELFRIDRNQDLGHQKRDVTSLLLIGADENFEGVFRARKPGVVSGLSALPELIRLYDPGLEFSPIVVDGARVAAGTRLATISGNKRSVLAVERPALNLLSHLSGVATATSEYVQAVEGTKCKICATRKTNPGQRQLEKWAVLCGGGDTHRIGLYDGVLIKDNHIDGVPVQELGAFVSEITSRARSQFEGLQFVQCEVDTLEQFEAVLESGVDMILLDNYLGLKETQDTSRLTQAVARRDEVAPDVLLEASGSVNMETIRAIAETNVDRVSIGAITHSAVVLDIGLDAS